MKTIGIKLADGSFFPVMEEGKQQTKQLELTTANNNQTCVMVDLYRSETSSMDDAEYIDTLKIENLVEHPDGEPSLAFSISLDENNQLTANIQDPETGAGATSDSSLSLVKRSDDELFTTDDYTIEESTNFIPSGEEEGPISFQGLYDKETEMGEAGFHEEKTSKKSKLYVRICLICAIICIIATLILIFLVPVKMDKKNTDQIQDDQITLSELEQPQTEVEAKKEEPKAPQAKDNEIVVIKQADKVEPSPVAKVSGKDVKYKLKWGDTLWDIASTYYKNPWKYKKIAAHNNIKNPDHIISGTVIVIPAE